MWLAKKIGFLENPKWACHSNSLMTNILPIQQDSCPLNVQKKNQTVENNKSRGKRLNKHS